MKDIVFPEGLPTTYERHESISSTNDRAWEIFSEKGRGAHGAVVTAGYQTKGRGRHGRTWNALPGRSLLMSVVVIPPSSLVNVQLVPLIAGVSIADALEEYKNIRAGIKWPNDIIFENKKLAGVLVESKSFGDSVSGVVIGIGVNVKGSAADFPEEIRDRTVTMEIASGGLCEVDDIYLNLLLSLQDYFYEAIYHPAFFHERLRELLVHEKGERIRLASGNDVVEGRFVEVNEKGELVLETGGGLMQYVQGEIVGSGRESDAAGA